MQLQMPYLVGFWKRLLGFHVSKPCSHVLELYPPSLSLTFLSHMFLRLAFALSSIMIPSLPLTFLSLLALSLALTFTSLALRVLLFWALRFQISYFWISFLHFRALPSRFQALHSWAPLSRLQASFFGHNSFRPHLVKFVHFFDPDPAALDLWLQNIVLL